MSPKKDVALKIPRHLGDRVLELRAEELRVKREARRKDVQKNFDNAIADLDIPFPWTAELRETSPLSTVHSFLMPYWYRAAERWVLYDVLPVEQINDEMDTGSLMSGEELKLIMGGVRPTDRPDYDEYEIFPVSDVQHEMWKRWKGFARPFWVLQGDKGGHQVRFSPEQATVLLRKGLEAEAPALGSLPPCPFDNRSKKQLDHLNRLHQFQDSIDRLRKSGSPEFAKAEQDRLEREVRESEMAFVEAQVRPLVEMASSLMRGPNTRSEHRDELIMVPDGTAARVQDAYDRYRETGDWTI